MKYLLTLMVLLASQALRAQSLALQERGSHGGVSIYGVLVEGKFVGTVAGEGDDVVSLQDFESSIGVYSKIYGQNLAKREAKEISVDEAGLLLRNLIQTLRPCVTFAQDLIQVPTWFAGKRPQGFETIDSKANDTFRLNSEELKRLQDVVSQRAIKRESTFRWLAFSSLSNDFHVWDIHLSSDFTELVWIRSQTLEVFLSTEDAD